MGQMKHYMVGLKKLAYASSQVRSLIRYVHFFLPTCLFSVPNDASLSKKYPYTCNRDVSEGLTAMTSEKLN